MPIFELDPVDRIAVAASFAVAILVLVMSEFVAYSATQAMPVSAAAAMTTCVDMNMSELDRRRLTAPATGEGD